jgi:hypothetical protein
MATYTAARALHKTLTAVTGGTEVDTVTLTNASQTLEVMNRGTTDPLYVREGVTPASAVPDPAVGGDDALVIPPGGIRTVHLPDSNTGNDIVVKLIAASAIPYSVQAGAQ